MLSVALMAHPRRQSFVDQQLPQLPGAELVLDRHDDRWETGRRALLAFDPAADYHCVVQDDAILCSDFLAGVERASKAAVDHPVGLYLGQARPHHAVVIPAVKRATEAGAPWIEMGGPWWGVAIALPTAQIPDLVRWGDRMAVIPNYDRRIATYYSKKLKIPCWYTVPSLVDHRPVAENPSMIAGRTGDRRAHCFLDTGSPLAIDWQKPPHRVDRLTPPSRRRTRSMAQKRIADRRIYGRNPAGRTVLVATPGQPIPSWYVEDAGAPTRPRRPSPRASQETYTKHATTDADPRVELAALKRGDLNGRAAKLGIEAPERLPNKDAVIEAIVERL